MSYVCPFFSGLVGVNSIMLPSRRDTVPSLSGRSLISFSICVGRLSPPVERYFPTEHRSGRKDFIIPCVKPEMYLLYSSLLCSLVLSLHERIVIISNSKGKRKILFFMLLMFILSLSKIKLKKRYRNLLFILNLYFCESEKLDPN